MAETDVPAEIPDRLKLNPSFTVIRRSPDEVRFLVGPFDGPAYTIRDDDEEGLVGDLIDCFDGNLTTAEIFASFPSRLESEILGLIQELLERNVLYDVGDSTLDQPSLGYGSIHPEFEPEQVDQLQSASVTIIPYGNLGSSLISDLVDRELGDVFLYRPADSDFEPRNDGQITQFDDLSTAFRDADLVVSTYDRPADELFSHLNELAHDTSTPWLAGGLQGFDGFVGPTVIPGETSCYECFRKRLAANTQRPEEYANYEDRINSPATADPFAAAFGRVVEGYLGIELFTRLLFGTGYTAGRVISFGFQNMTVEANDVLQLPQCRICGPEGPAEQQFVDFEQYIEDT